MKRRCLTKISTLVLLLSIFFVSSAFSEEENLVLPVNGGFLDIAASDYEEYGEGWVATDLTNGIKNEDGWASEKDPDHPQSFVYSFKASETFNPKIR